MSKIELKSKVKVPEGNGVTAWSISRLNTYTQCPLKFKLTAIDKLKEPGSAAMDRGAAIHKEAEVYLKGSDPVVPANLSLMAAEFIEIRDLGAKAELEVTFTKDWGITGWFDADAWCRIKIDAMVLDKDTIRIIDFKTGKFRPNDNEAYEAQLELYALTALVLYPDVKHVSGELWFLDSGDHVGTKHGSYTHADVQALKTKWEEKVTPMFVDTMFAPRLNQYCKWCFFREDNGGPCNA